MAIIKCKMCGGDIELAADKTFGSCEFCGSTMTFPKVDDEQRAAAFNRGNHFRRIGEFDKALAVYERIVREDDTDAEAHWCCALCRFGIEYVEDPATYEYLPTCHRASFDSFLEDVDYKAAVEHSDGITRRQYQKDGAKIAEVQRGILATSQNTEPYDVFICYKESDENGDRTRDSLMAQDIYYQLTEQGRKVFFARITLEDVAGTQYEPYIFAALNSARVMVVVGTKAEHMNAVWVKNEWSRFLAMMKKDRHKLLLPCYRDMDPYDMPEALSVLQSYDMSRIGFIQDLTRGIAKVLDAEKKPEPVKETVVVQQSAPAANSTAPLLKRAFMFLEDGDWDRADDFCEQVLNIDPECAEAYVGKLMAELRVNKQEKLNDCADPFDNKNNYQKAMRFGDDGLKKILVRYIVHINNRNELARLEGLYTDAISMMRRAITAKDFEIAAGKFKAIEKYKDSAALHERCITSYKDEIYRNATQKVRNVDSEESLKEARALFASIPGWKDADAQLQQLPEMIETARKNGIYNKALENARVSDAASLRKAIDWLQMIPEWKDSSTKIEAYTERVIQIEEEERRKREEQRKQAEAKALRERRYQQYTWKYPIIKKKDSIEKELQQKEIERIVFPFANKIAWLLGSIVATIVSFALLVELDSGFVGFLGVVSLTVAIVFIVQLYKGVNLLLEIKELKKQKKEIEKLPPFFETVEEEEANRKEQERLAEIVRKEKESRSKCIKKIAIITTAIVCAIIAFVIVLNANKQYNDAVALMDAGNLDEAYILFSELGNYKDAVDNATNIQKERLKDIKVGSYINFGAYEQDNNRSNGKENVEWLVLAVTDGKALVISKFALDNKQYHTSSMDVTWETCSLRKWLNKAFINSAFSADEKAMITAVTVSADKNPEHSTNPGNPTQDRVFLLSITEANQYFSSNDMRQCKPTAYAVANGADISDNGNCCWWLRSPGFTNNRAAYAYDSGDISVTGVDVYEGYGYSDFNILTVRPAMWIDISNLD